jgi:hypothetical protein
MPRGTEEYKYSKEGVVLDRTQSDKHEDVALNHRPMTRARVRTFLQDHFEDFGSIGIRSYDTWSLFFAEYFSEDYIHIRASGNPLFRDDFARLLSSDTKVIMMKLVGIESITIMSGGMSAVVVYTTDQIFSYKGNVNEGRALMSCVLELRDGEIKIVHDQRSEGQPIPQEDMVSSRWAS